MAFLTASTFGVTNDALIDVMTSGIAWNVPENRTISWALADGLNDAWKDRPAAIEDFQRALDSFEAFIDVEFDYVGVFNSPITAGETGADIVYTLSLSPDEPTLYAFAYYPGPGVFDSFFDYATEEGDIFMNFANDIIASSSYEAGSDGFYTIIHELGHAMGLKHPFEEDLGRPGFEDIQRDDILDVEWFTIMSYTDPFEEELERWDPATPMLLDVLALQYMYGANMSTNAGNTTHVLEQVDYLYSIWDASGVDTVDASQLSEGWRIALPDYEDTPLVETRSGFALPRREFNESLLASTPRELVWLIGDIEDAIGSAHDDVLLGTRLENVMSGQAGNDDIEGFEGNDTLSGGAGDDIAFYSGYQDSYTIRFGPEGTQIEDRRADGNGIDFVSSIETLSFYEGEATSTFNLERFSAPTDLSDLALEAFIELYIAYFNRAPDAQGLWFWGSAFANGVVSLEQAASFFIDQAETRETYPDGLSNLEFATAVYNNVLGRAPDQDGLNFWVDVLDNAVFGRDQFILEVLGGAKADPDLSLGQSFVDQQLADRDYLATKTDIGALFAVHRGMSDVNHATTVMSLFDGTQRGVNAAVAAIEQYYVAALDPDDGAILLPLVGVLDSPFDTIA
jgi:serralysin